MPLLLSVFDALQPVERGPPVVENGDAGAEGRDTFLAEVEALRAALASSAAFHPGHAVAAAHAAIRAKIPFLDRDRALDGEVATAVRLVESGEILAAVRHR